MGGSRMPTGRRELAKQEKRERILAAARELFARHGVGGVTTQQIADRADVAIGTPKRVHRSGGSGAEQVEVADVDHEGNRVRGKRSMMACL